MNLGDKNLMKRGFMTFKMFDYPGPWWKKVIVYFWFKFWGHYIANTSAQVPFYRQPKRNGQEYQLPNGTQCYIAEFDLVVQLRGDRWFALGDSDAAKKLNNEISYYSDASQASKGEILAEIQKYIKNQDVSDQIIQAELDKAGVVIVPFKEF